MRRQFSSHSAMTALKHTNDIFIKWRLCAQEFSTMELLDNRENAQVTLENFSSVFLKSIRQITHYFFQSRIQ